MADKDKKDEAKDNSNMANVSKEKDLTGFLMKLDAEKMLFGGKKLGEETISTSVKMTNPTKDRYLFKIKCTSNELFRIRPPVGAIGPGEEVNITVSFNPGKSIPDTGKHYFAMYHLKCGEKDKEKTARHAWAEHKNEYDGGRRVYMEFSKEARSYDKDKEQDDKKEKDKDKDEKKEKDKDKKDDKKE